MARKRMIKRFAALVKRSARSFVASFQQPESCTPVTTVACTEERATAASEERSMQQHTQQLPAILIVEDDPDILTILHRLIRALADNYDIITADNGAAALEQLTLRTVRLVITDYNM